MSQFDTQADASNNTVMSSRTSLNVSLTPALEKFIHNRVAAGRYQTASEVVREALRLLELRERELDEAYDALKRKLRRGAAQAKRGELIDGQEVFDELLSVFQTKKKARSK
ncbi:MAG TPA: type II toxin-antitoxin system ParD family antitoxin [Humisphaera sp.]|nr:type II toxin-antitoxin system ParD family antitoxin [Humisphaera sp.]